MESSLQLRGGQNRQGKQQQEFHGEMSPHFQWRQRQRPSNQHQQRGYHKKMMTSVLLPQVVLFFLLVLVSSVYSSAAEKEDANTKETKEKRVAIATLVTTSTYIPGALVLAESLRQVNAKGDKLLLWVGPEDDERSDLTPAHIEQLKQNGWDRTIQLSKANNTYTECKISQQHRQMMEQNPQLKTLDRYWGTCSKFAVWTLTDYDVVVYMDADSMALHNFDFVFDYLDVEGAYSFAAHGVPECWDTDPPNFGECNFYTAFFVIKPLPHIQNYFHNLANQQWLAEGEITLLNQVISHWRPLPRFTLSAQTEVVRPTNPTTGKMESRLAKVYDFAGSPDNKPWMSYQLAKEKNDPNYHAYFGSMIPGTEGHERYMIPQIMWNQYYDQVLKKIKNNQNKKQNRNQKKNQKKESKEEL